MEKQTPTGDRISALPDDILHCILRRVDSPRVAAQTILLSRRWSTAWDSYPTVDFDHKDYSNRQKKKPTPGSGVRITMMMSDFQQFGKSSINRYSRNPLLRMESLNLSILVRQRNVCRPTVEQLLALASERKAEEIAVVVSRGGRARSYTLFDLPFRLLSNSTAKSLKLGGIAFRHGSVVGGRFIPLKHLQILDLENVELEDGAFASLIAGCPLLETIRLERVMKLRKLRICSNLANLKTLEISYGQQVEEVEIQSLRLQTLRIEEMETPMSKFELTAPRLEVLEISWPNLPVVDLNTMVSKLRNLKSLSLTDIFELGPKASASPVSLKLSVPKLEQFKLMVPNTLEEIELDSGPCLAKFELIFLPYLSGRLNRCVIGQVPASFRSGFCCSFDIEHEWFVRFKSLLSTFPHSQTVDIDGDSTSSVRFEEEQVDHTRPAIDINHLEIKTAMLEAVHQLTLLDGLFWACHPRSVTFTNMHYKRERLFETFSSLINKHNGGGGEGFYQRHNWRRQLKDVTTISSKKEEYREQVEFRWH